MRAGAAVRGTRIVTLCIAQVIVLGAVPASGAECLIYRNSIKLGTQLSVQMMAPSGQDCRVRLPPEGRTVLDDNRVTAHPHHGGVRVEGFTGAAYRSNPGYKGPDRFGFEYCGRQDDKTVCTGVNVKVDVR